MKILHTVVALLIALPAGLHAQAVDEWGAARTGSWFTVSNWSLGFLPDGDPAVINAGGTAQIASGDASPYTLGIASTASSTGALTLSGGTLYTTSLGIGAGGIGSLTVSGGALYAIGNPAVITVGGAGTGTLTLASGSVRTGYVTAVENHGTVNINGGTWTGQFTIASGGTVNINGGTLNGGTSPASDRVSGTLNLNAGSWLGYIGAGLDSPNGTVNIKSGSGVITDLDILNQSVATVTGGQWSLGRIRVNNGSRITMTGGSFLSNQAVQIGDATDAATFTLSSGAILDVPSIRLMGAGGATLNIGAFDLANPTTADGLYASTVSFINNGAGAGGTRVINFNQTGTIVFDSQITTDPGVGGSVVQRGGGTTILLGANAYNSGTTITGGGLIAANNSALGIGGVTVNGGELGVSDLITIANAITIGGTGGAISNYIRFRDPGYNAMATFAGPITLGGPLNIVALSTARSSTTVTGGIAGTGNITIQTGEGASVTISGATVNPVGTLTHQGGGSGAATISAVIGAKVTSVTQNSASPLILTRANLYSGPTTVSSGTLLANNTTGSATGSGAVTVQAAGTLGGTGFISGNTAIFGTLSPGNGGGTLTFTLNLTLKPGSSTNIELGSLAPSGFDSVSVGSVITYGGTLNLTLINGFMPQVGDAFVLFRGFNAFSGSFSSVTFSDPNIVGQFAPDSGTLTIAAIPEPSTGLLALLGLLALVGVSRRRKAANNG